MEAGVRGVMMDQAEATLYGAFLAGVFGIFGALLGVLVGLFGERYLRRQGEVRCTLRPRHIGWATGGELEPPIPPINEVEDFSQVFVRVVCDLSFFNEKEVNTGLFNIRVVFVADGDEAFIGTGLQEQLHTVNLPSRTWSDTKVEGEIVGPESRLVRDWQTIEVRGLLPDFSSYRRVVMQRSSESELIFVPS
jgi:hypothetical protein